MKVAFINQPRMEPLADDQWRLIDKFEARVACDDGQPVYITVPPGFETDLASVPRLPLTYMLFGGRARRSAILHDWLYRDQWPRKWADEVFLAAMEAEGVGWATRWAMYLGVRVGGGAYYARHNPTGETE